MEGKRTIEKIRLRNILSFGDKGEEIELQPLNVLIGQNASGKSNFIDIFKLLRSLPQDKGLQTFISKSGGISEWIWKGTRTDDYSSTIIFIKGLKTVNYEIQFKEMFQKLFIKDEIIQDMHDGLLLGRSEDVGYSGSLLEPDFLLSEETLARGYISHVFSILLFYTDLQTTRNSKIRTPQLPDAPNDFLEEDGSNLALVLNDLEHRGNTKDKIVSYLKKFNPRIKDYSIRILGGTVQLFVREEGLEKPISAMRLSDGTLRYLCLLAILCHPEPPPLICLEEPEVGLHPDILPTIAELLIDASQRTQLIVTTHSDILVSALSDIPEAVLVCEADEDGTHFKRLDKENLKEWLDEYELGEVWLRGGIGGTR
jgi:predicted ATPase